MTCMANNTKTLKVGSSCIQFQNTLSVCINIIFNILSHYSSCLEIIIVNNITLYIVLSMLRAISLFA